MTLKSMDSEKRALQRELLSWGLDPQNNEEHQQFAAFVAEQIQQCQLASTPAVKVAPVDLPQDINEAIVICHCVERQYPNLPPKKTQNRRRI